MEKAVELKMTEFFRSMMEMNEAHAEYLKKVQKARILSEELGSLLDEVIKRPQITIGDFEES